MANYQVKDAKTADIQEIYFDKNVNKMCYKDALGIIKHLESTATPEKTFVGILTQSGTSVPSVTNNITDFGVPTITRDGVGSYSVTFTGGPLIINKTYIGIVNGSTGTGFVNAQYQNTNAIRITTFNTTGVLADSILIGAQLFINIKN
jgi:hypothetical protein